MSDHDLYGEHVCRSTGHSWDIEPVGTLFGKRPHVTEPVVSTCTACGIVRTYWPDGAVTIRFGGAS